MFVSVTLKNFRTHKSTRIDLHAATLFIGDNGFLKAAAIGLLVSARELPALVLLEEIENGINPGNFQTLMRWIWQTSSPTHLELPASLSSYLTLLRCCGVSAITLIASIHSVWISAACSAK